jgi:hypothetical protein
METEILRLLISDYITPRAAAFLIHAIIEMTNCTGDGPANEQFKKHVLELFKYDEKMV